MITEATIQEMISILKKSDQTLIFLDSLICPVRELIGHSYRDHEMRVLAAELKRRKVIDNWHGYTGSDLPVHVYASSFTLNKEWFLLNCRPRITAKQLQLF